MINSKLLKAAIVENGMTQLDVSKKIGISYQSLNDKINNKTDFKIDEVSRLCSVLGIESKREQIFFADKNRL